MDCIPPGSSVHGILQARILEWVAISFSRGSSRPRDGTQVSYIADEFFAILATREALQVTTPPSISHLGEPPQGSTLGLCSSHTDRASPETRESVIQRIQWVLYLHMCLLNRGKTVIFSILNKQK